MPRVILHCVDDVLSRSNRRSSVEEVPDLRTLAAIAAKTLGVASGDDVVLCLNGEPVNDPAMRLVAVAIEDGDVVLASRRVAGLDPVSIAAAVAISIALSFASSALSPKPRLARARTTADDAQRQYSIARYSSSPVSGDTRPVVMGRLVRYGGKEIFAIPSSSADGSGGDTLRILIELSAGPIQSIGSIAADVNRVDSASISGIYLDDQPVSQFRGVRISARMGTAGQRAIPGFEDIERLRDVGVGGAVLRNTSGAPRTGASASAEAFRFVTQAVHHATLRVELAEGLYSLGNSGQVEPRRVEYRHRWRLVSSGPAGAWSAWSVTAVTQARQSAFTSAPRLDAIVPPPSTPAAVEIEVERVTPEIAAGTGADTLTWVQVVEGVESTQRYPGRAMLAIEVPASEQVQSKPRVSVDLRGIKVRVWDGVSSPDAPVFTIAHTDNPAWLALEYLTNTVWGMALTDAAVDLPRLVRLGQRCDQLVDRFPGPGGLSRGQRKRYACNLSLDRPRRADEWLRTILACADAVPLPTGGVWTLLSEEPQPVSVESFGDGDMLAGDDGEAQIEIRREWTGAGGERPNQIIAQIEAVDDPADPAALRDSRSDTVRFPADGERWLAQESPRPETVRLEGVTDRDQALARAMVLALKARRISRSVSFTTTRPFVACLPGDRIDVSCDVMGWGLSGRLLAGNTASVVRLDRDLEMPTGVEMALRVEYADGTLGVAALVVQGGPTLIPAGTPLPLAAGASLPAAPPDLAAYAVGRVDAVSKPMIVTSVAMADGPRRLWKIEAQEYDESIFDPSGASLPPVVYSTLETLTMAPGPMRSISALDETIAGRRVVTVSWSQSAIDARRTGGVRIYRRRPGSVATGTTGAGGGGVAILAGAWVLEPARIDAAARRAVLDQLALGDVAYEFVAIAVSPAGVSLSPDDTRHPVARLALGLAGPTPLPHTGLVAAVSGGNRVRLGWTPVSGLLRAQVSSCGFDHFSGANTSGQSIEHALPIARTEPGPGSTSIGPLALPPNVPARFWVRSCDGPPETGRLSREFAWLSVTPGVPPGRAVKSDVTLTTASAGAVPVNLGANIALGGSQWVLLGSASTGTVTFAAVDTGAATLAELTFLPGLVQRHQNPSMSSLDLMLPSLEADSWSVRRLTPVVAAELVPTLPPWPDEAVRVSYEVRLNDGTAWGAWMPIAFGEAVSGLIRQWQMRATITVANVDKPYRIGLRSIRVVLTH